MTRLTIFSRKLIAFVLMFSLLGGTPLSTAYAQNEVTGAFRGKVVDAKTKDPIEATVRFINQDTQTPVARKADNQGQFSIGNLNPGRYVIEFTAKGYKPHSAVYVLQTMRSIVVIPEPIELSPLPPELPVVAQNTAPQPAVVTPTPTPAPIRDEVNIFSEISAPDPRRSASFTGEEVAALPLGGTTLTRSFDELALLVPGVALPPQTQGGVAGPGVGPGVGSAGQFTVNGLRSRGNNFTVDGSDNNDEDIGVRRQGFFALVPQSIESVREYQITTLLAPAQYGRNMSAQVNAVSRAGSEKVHGSFYGFFNSSDLNAREYFDGTSSRTVSPLHVGNQPVRLIDGLDANFRPINSRALQTLLDLGGKDSLTLAQGGFTFGGPIQRPSAKQAMKPVETFYFFALENQFLNANKEANFAVPTVEQRGAFDSGATGVFKNPIKAPGQNENVFAWPTGYNADAVFSMFPFANNQFGIYGTNTYTHVLPSKARSTILSGRVDDNFSIKGRNQSLAARYNFTNDLRNIPVTGGALFSGVESNVQTQNFSINLNGDISNPNATKIFTNQLRLSYGRTQLNFQEGRDVKCQSIAAQLTMDTGCLMATSTFSTNLERLTPIRSEQFFLNRPIYFNSTLPATFGVKNSGPINYAIDRVRVGSIDQILGTDLDIGPVGQVVIAGFSPAGADVFSFPQSRANNTYQLADTVNGRILDHGFAFGIDSRRSELHSNLPRNSRPLITFYGAPRFIFNADFSSARLASIRSDSKPFLTPQDFAGAGAASGTFLSISNNAQSAISLRYYQTNLFAQDEWRVRPNLTLNFGIRYEYNTPVRDANDTISGSFSSALIGESLPGLSRFIDGRKNIYEPDRNNFAPRFGFAYSLNPFGPNRSTVIRGGYGLYYDQILGAVVSQSRNVFPNFLTTNLGGGPIPFELGYDLFNPLTTTVGRVPIIMPRTGEPNRMNPALTPKSFIQTISDNFPTPFGATLPERYLKTPLSHQYHVSVEQQLSQNLVLSTAYIGTLGRDLLRFSTPNLGQNNLLAPYAFRALQPGDDLDGDDVFDLLSPTFFGATLSPGLKFNGTIITGASRPVANVGAINLFQTNASSRYDSLQLQLKGRYQSQLQYQFGYTFSHALDDVSDVFDLAGAFNLPQNSLSRDERASANFDVRHRFAYSMSYLFPTPATASLRTRQLLSQFEVHSTGQWQTGQPFTVNSLYDVNLDGNLTDRLNSISGITQTSNSFRPLELASNLSTLEQRQQLLAVPGRDGAVGRNTFRAGGYFLMNLAMIKHFTFKERHKITFRTEAFNLTNRMNFGIPVRFLEAPGFGQATDTVSPGRRVQFALKYSF